MIEYDFELKKECSWCFGKGFLIRDYKLYNSLSKNAYHHPCNLCDNTGYISLPELELEDTSWTTVK